MINEHNDPNLAETPHYKEKQTILPHPISSEQLSEKKMHTPVKRTHDGKLKKDKKDAYKSPQINEPDNVSDTLIKAEEAKIDMRKLVIDHKSHKKSSSSNSDKSSNSKSHTSSKKQKDKHRSRSSERHRSHSSKKSSKHRREDNHKSLSNQSLKQSSEKEKEKAPISSSKPTETTVPEINNKPIPVSDSLQSDEIKNTTNPVDVISAQITAILPPLPTDDMPEIPPPPPLLDQPDSTKSENLVLIENTLQTPPAAKVRKIIDKNSSTSNASTDLLGSIMASMDSPRNAPNF